ncbi:MAG: hypothetical protein IJJ47_13725 [Methanosphaera sp.]|nr:hypothetical protein [Methanosphaera sp.]
MYVNSQAVNIEYSGNITSQIIEKVIQFKNRIQNYFKSKINPQFDLITCFNNFSDLLFSIELFKIEFTAFSNLRIIIEHIIDNNIINNNIDFVNKNFDLFFDLLESKINLIKKEVSQSEYAEQLEIYDSKIQEYNSYFFKNIYETTDDNQDAIAIGKILLE